MSRLGRKFYRDKYNGKLLGICAGLDDYFGVNALWFRLGMIVIFFAGFVFIVPIYLLAALITAKKPPQLYTESLTHTFSDRNAIPSARIMPGPASREGIDQ